MKLFREIRRRNFCKVGVVYVVTAWLVWQIVVLAVENITLPDWTIPAFKLVVLVAFPAVMVAAWLLELTPDGLKLQKDIDPAESIARKTGRQLNRGIIMILAMALVLYLTDHFREQVWPGTEESQPDPQATGQLETVTAKQQFTGMRRQGHFTINHKRGLA